MNLTNTHQRERYGVSEKTSSLLTVEAQNKAGSRRNLQSGSGKKIRVHEIMGVETTTVHKITGVENCDTLDPLFPAGVKRDGNREKVDFLSAARFQRVPTVTAVNSRFRSLKGYRSIYLCFSTSHAALHPAHTQRERRLSQGRSRSCTGNGDLFIWIEWPGKGRQLQEGRQGEWERTERRRSVMPFLVKRWI